MRGLTVLICLFVFTACAGYDDEIEALQDDIDLIKGHLSDADNQITQLQQDITHLETQIDEYEKETAPCFDAVTLVDAKLSKTYTGEMTSSKNVKPVLTDQDHPDNTWVRREILQAWHAEIEILFFQTPVGLEVLNTSATHFKDFDEQHLRSHYWEQTENIVTLYLTFNGAELFQDWTDRLITYERAKEMYKDIDWSNWAAYTVDFTLDWDTGRKRFRIPIRPSDPILEWY